MFARCLMAGADPIRRFTRTDGTHRLDGDHLQSIRNQPARVQGLHDLLPEPCQSPAPEPAMDGRPLAKLLGKVPPRRPRRCDPENRIHNNAVVQELHPFGARTPRMKRSRNAYSSSDIGPHAKLVSIADARLTLGLRALCIPFVNTC